MTVNLNGVLAQELLKPLIKNFKRRKVYARFKNNISGADLAEMESLSNKNQGAFIMCRRCFDQISFD